MEMVTEIALLLALATGVSLIMRLLRQPMIVGYILTGIIAGPQVLNVIHNQEALELFSQIGIIFLLFIVGLNLNPKIISEVGKVSLVTGIGQIIFTSLIGFILALLLGIERIAALYVAIALTFSSTIIILKLISDKNDLEKLYAKIAIGFLLVQDIAATLILIAVGIISQSGGSGIGNALILTLIKGIWVIVILLAISHWVLPRLTRRLAESQEMLFLFSASWALGLAALFAVLGFSVEIGALVAGVSLAATAYAGEMASRLKPLRDIFILIFFILLGSHMVLSDMSNLIIPALILSLFVLIGNPIIVVILMNILGYSRKTGFLAGLTVAQISEFSLILAALGFQVGHVPAPVLSLITLVGLITIAGSTYLILYAEQIYPFLSKWLHFLEIIKTTPNESERQAAQAKIILFGYDRVGADFVKTFQALKKPFLVIDFNPASISRLETAGIPCFYGDASDPDFLAELPIEHIELCVSTIPEISTNLAIQRRLNQLNTHAITVLLAHTTTQAKALYDAGASYVLLPHYLGAQYAAKLIYRYGLKKTPYKEAREKHLHSFANLPV
jgi:Kef-type K+ transport system membrane component KefB